MTPPDKQQPFAMILMGSQSDLPVMQNTMDTLDALGVRWEAAIRSAHRTPHDTHEQVRDADARGCAVFIVAAGLAAHLAGAVAALTSRPVIGVPMEGGPLNGKDALLSTVQMPGGVPVACMAIGKAGARNAAWLAAQIMALGDAELDQRVRHAREQQSGEVRAQNDALQQRLGRGNT